MHTSIEIDSKDEHKLAEPQKVLNESETVPLINLHKLSSATEGPDTERLRNSQIDRRISDKPPTSKNTSKRTSTTI